MLQAKKQIPGVLDVHTDVRDVRGRRRRAGRAELWPDDKRVAGGPHSIYPPKVLAV